MTGRAGLIAPLGGTSAKGSEPLVATLLTKPGGTFYWYSATSTPDSPQNLQFADVNGDGKPDVVYLVQSNFPNGGDVAVLRNEGNGKFASPQYIYDTNKSFGGFGISFFSGPIPAPLKKGEKSSIFFGGPEKNTTGFLGVLINETK